ncbi:MAG: O-antigen ligase family protein [Pseudomonadales bacterium]|nr:O-antigen ligase family protein [Pseudomonadales bacterium]
MLLLASAIFTHSIPLSLDSLIFYFSSFCVYVFFESLKQKKIFSPSEFIYTYLLVGFALSLFFIGYFSYPNLSTFLPPINVLTAVYGHSHFAAILIFLIPLAWWYVFVDDNLVFRFKKPLLILFYILLILSFGRLAFLISLVQLPFLYNLVESKQFKKSSFYLVNISLGFVLLLIIFSSFVSKESCYVATYKNQLCKQITNEARPEYFKQSLLSIKENPIFGFGPGTFQLITRKYTKDPQYSSIYAHNFILQLTSESGLLSGLFFSFIIIFIIKKGYEIYSQKDDKFLINKFVYIGFISLLINSFFDYDWNLFPIFLMSLIFAAFFLHPEAKKSEIKTDLFLKFTWLLFSLVIIILGVVNLLTRMMIKDNAIDLAFKTFPYFFSQSKVFLSNRRALSDSNRAHLYKIYQNHEEFILRNIEESEDLLIKELLYDQIRINSPDVVFNEEYLKTLKELEHYEKLGEVSSQGLTVLNNLDNELTPQQQTTKLVILKYLHIVALSLLQRGDIQHSIIYYRRILPTLFIINPNDNYHIIYNNYFSSSSNWNDYLKEYLSLLYETDQQSLRELLTEIMKMNQESIKNGYSEGIFLGEYLANLAISIGNNDLKNQDIESATNMYKMAFEFDEWSFNRLSPDVFTLLNNDEQIQQFWLNLEGIPIDHFGIHIDRALEAYHSPNSNL